jgi:hypothetical protein
LSPAFRMKAAITAMRSTLVAGGPALLPILARRPEKNSLNPEPGRSAPRQNQPRSLKKTTGMIALMTISDRP